MACASCNCDSCECTKPIQIPVGQPGPPGEAIPGQNGVGEDGDKGEEGPEGPPGENLDEYDSGWKKLPYIDEQIAFNGLNFGIAPVRGTSEEGSAYPRPSIRIVNRTLFFNGAYGLPLAVDGYAGQVLLTDFGTIFRVGSMHKYIYQGSDGGFSITGKTTPEYEQSGSIASITPIMPVAIAPDKVHFFSSNKFIGRATRPLTSTGGALSTNRSITYSAYVGVVVISEAGKLIISTHTDLDDSGSSDEPVNNSPLHQLITNVTAGDQVGTYDGRETGDSTNVWKSSYPEIGDANAGTLKYPIDINCDLASDLGGFEIYFHGSYPIRADKTIAEIKAAFDSIATT
jgi:hypothetical protein